MIARMYWNRRIVYGALILLGSLMVNEALPEYTLLHGKLKEWADPVLDVTGLSQGSWELFAPTPDHVNVRVGARLVWRDEPETIWLQPNWHEMSPWEKSLSFREMSYFDGLWRLSNHPALEPFCRHLAAEQARKTGHQLVSLTLFEERDEIPPPNEEWRPAHSAPHYSIQADLYTWTPDD